MREILDEMRDSGMEDEVICRPAIKPIKGFIRQDLTLQQAEELLASI